MCTVCDANCKSVAGAVSFCGDAIVDPNAETCDDGNTVTELCPYGKGTCTVCTSTCKTGGGIPNYCGDGTVNAGAGEVCDDGNTSNLDNCSNACKTCGAIPGLSQTGNVTNSVYSNAGLAFTATANATLYQFTYNHQGLADTITLASSDGAALGTVAVPAGSANPLVVDVNWSLSAGVAYRLTTGNALNERFANAPANTFPVAAAGGIRVDSSWIPGVPSKNLDYWLTFTNLRSCMR